MIFKIAALSLIFSVSAFGATWIDEFPVYVDGDVETMAAIFDGIKRILSSDAIQDALLPIVMLIGLWVSLKTFVNGSRLNFFATLSVFVVASMSLFNSGSSTNFQSATGVSVKILNQKAIDGNSVLKSSGVSTYTTIDNIPYIIAMPIAATSSTAYWLSNLIDDSFSTVTDLGYSNMGFMGGTHVIMKAIQDASLDKNATLREYRDAVKNYVSQCVVAIAVNKDYSLINKLTSPEKSVRDSLKWFNDSFSASDTMDNGELCTQYYQDNIGDKNTLINSFIVDNLNKKAGEIDLESTTLANALSSSYLAQTESSVVSGSNKFLNFLTEGPVMSAVLSGVMSQQLGADLAGQNASTLSGATKAIANLQYEGIGNWNWIIKIIPFYIHFMRGVIYMISILIFLVVIALGYEKGMPIFYNYIKGLITFEATVVALAVVNALVNMYSYQDASNQLFSGNPLTLENTGEYLNYIATMQGVAGVVGLFALLSIPAMIFSGNVSAAMSGLSSLAGQYKGNTAQDLQDNSARSSGARRAIDDMSPEFTERLRKKGISAPEGVADLEYANKVLAGVNSSASGLASLNVMPDLGDLNKASYANSSTQIQSGISEGLGKIDGGAINVDGSVNGGLAAELRQQSKESISSSIAKGNALNSSFSQDEIQKFAGHKIEQAGEIEEEVEKIKNSNAYKRSRGSARKKFDSKLETMSQEAQQLRDEAKDISELSFQSPLSSESRTSAAVANALNETSKSVASGEMLKKKGLISEDGYVSAIGFQGQKNEAVSPIAATMKTGEIMSNEMAAINSVRGVMDAKNKALGTIDSQILNSDGSEGKEFDKYMDGGRLSERIAINKQNLASGAVAKNLEKLENDGKFEDGFNQTMANLQVSSAGSIEDDMSKAKGSRKSLNVDHDNDGYIESVSNDKTYKMKDKDGKVIGKGSRDSAFEAIGESEMQSAIGKGAGIKENLKKDESIYRDNAMYGELSQQQTTSSKIDALGGIDKAVGLDTTAASLKAMKDSGATAGELSKFIQTSNPGMGKDAADQLARGIIDGSKQGANEFTKALQSASSLSAAQSSAKTGSDLKAVSQFDSPEDFIQAQESSAAYKAGQTKAQVEALKTKGSNGKSMLDEDGNVTDFGQDSLERREQYNMGEQMRRNSLIGDGKHMKSVVGKLINNGFDETKRREIAKAAVDLGMLEEMPEFDSEGNVDPNSLKVSTGAKMARALGEAEGNRLTDKMGGVVLAGVESSIKGDSVSSKEENSTTRNNQRSYRDGINVDTGGEVSALVSQYKALHGREPTLGETVELVRNSQMAEAAKNKFFGHTAALLADATESNASTIETALVAGGSAIGALNFEKYFGAPVSKTVKKLHSKAKESIFGKAEPKSSNGSRYDSDNGSEYQSNDEHDKSTKEKNRHGNNSFSDMQNYTKEYGKHKEAFESESKNLEKLQNQRDSLYAQGKDTSAIDKKIDESFDSVNSHKNEMHKANKNFNKAYSAVKSSPNFQKSFGSGKAFGGIATAIMIADLMATGDIDEALEVAWDGTKDTMSKIKQGNITGKDGAASNISSLLIGKKATNYLADGDYSMAALHALTNTADSFGSVVDMAASAVVAPFSEKSYSELRNKDFSITESAANIINNTSDWLTSPSGPPGGSGQTPGSSGYVPPHARNAFSSQSGSNTMSAIKEGEVQHFHEEGTKVINSKGDSTVANIEGGQKTLNLNRENAEKPSYLTPDPQFTSMSDAVASSPTAGNQAGITPSINKDEFLQTINESISTNLPNSQNIGINSNDKLVNLQTEVQNVSSTSKNIEDLLTSSTASTKELVDELKNKK